MTRLGVLVVAALVTAALPASAQTESESQPENTAASAPPPAAESDTASSTRGKRTYNSDVFDNRTQVIPPSQLTKMKRSTDPQPRSIGMKDALQTISVTPDGKVSETVMSPELEKRIRLYLNKPDKKSESTGSRDSAREAFAPRSVIGVDTREPVTNTTRYPFSAIGRVEMGCSGTLIGPRHVLTAGHCVYNIENDKWYANVNFAPGQNGGSRPYGNIGWVRALTVKGWTDQKDERYDYAMIILDRDIGTNTGWFGFTYEEPMSPYTVNINGYPGDKPYGTMWHAYCQISRIDREKLYYPCDTYGGMSGSSIYVFDQGKNTRMVYGIHAYGTGSDGQANSGTRIDEIKFNVILGWKTNN